MGLALPYAPEGTGSFRAVGILDGPRADGAPQHSFPTVIQV